MTITVKKWASYDDHEVGWKTIGGFGGFFQDGMRWVDYIATWAPEATNHLEALRAEILEKKIRRGGDWHQENEQGIPVFSDDTVGLFSLRAWGDLMAAVWSEHDNKDYSYMSFYMESCMETTDAQSV